MQPRAAGKYALLPGPHAICRSILSGFVKPKREWRHHRLLFTTDALPPEGVCGFLKSRSREISPSCFCADDAGIVKDARHVVSSTRAAWGRSPEEQTQQQKIPSVPSKRTLMEQTGSTTDSRANVENGHPAESTTADRGHTAESGSCMDLKLRNTAHGSTSAPYIPLHGLLFCLCELHMKTPEEIMEKVNKRNAAQRSEACCRGPDAGKRFTLVKMSRGLLLLIIYELEVYYRCGLLLRICP